MAEWFRLQLKEKTWKGLAEHALDGWNIGPAPYGYLAVRVPHPVPVKASQGRPKTRLALDPARAPGGGADLHLAGGGQARHAHHRRPAQRRPGPLPAPGPRGGPPQTVYAILGNPKYTGHMVYGRVRTRNGRRVTVPPDQWLWSPQPAHPSIVDRATWQAAQDIGAEHATSRDGHPCQASGRGPDLPVPGPGPVPGLPPPDERPAYGRGPVPLVYYQCPHNPGPPQDAATHPDHPRTVKAPEIRLDQIVGLLFPVAQDDDVAVIGGEDVGTADGPAGGVLAGPWCACWRGGGQSVVTSVTAARALCSSTMDLRPAMAAMRAGVAALLRARGRPGGVAVQPGDGVIAEQGVLAPGQLHVVAHVRPSARQVIGWHRVPGGDPLVQGGEDAHAQLPARVGWPISIQANGLALSISAFVMSRSSSSWSGCSRCASSTMTTTGPVPFGGARRRAGRRPGPSARL